MVDFNNGFAAVLDQLRAALPGIKLYSPDFFTLLNNMLKRSPPTTD